MEANDRNLSEYEKQWIDTKIAFNRALRSTDNFNAFHWVSRLLRAGVGYLYFKTGLTKLGIHRTGRSYVPFFAVSLVSLVLLSYFTRLRFVILKRWCCDVEMKEATCMENCKWPLLHDFFVSYVGIMILFNYISACFRSPGVALAAKYECFDSSDSIPDEMKWKAADCQGGCCGLNPYLDLKKEKSRASLCIDNGLETHETAGFPTNEWSFCKKCEITRPPRTHHCSICQRCVIRFDHHCVWMNNCIGYNNYRQFLLVLFYLSLGCFYGVAVLSKTFYEPLKRQVEEHGFRILYDYNVRKSFTLHSPALFPLTLVCFQYADRVFGHSADVNIDETIIFEHPGGRSYCEACFPTSFICRSHSYSFLLISCVLRAVGANNFRS
jgi:hypothetical protein